jgi:nitrate reductase alpha subunit
MSYGRRPATIPGVDRNPVSPLDQLRHFKAVGGLNADLPWSARSRRSRDWEHHYRDRWQHDKVVRSTHGVNCTGSCSWKVHVKDGIITWETQQTDYPSNGHETPDYEPRGCPRGASFSWYTYSPLRVKHPYVRGALLDCWRAARAEHADPVEAWAAIAGDRAYTAQRGKGGFARASWEEVAELIAAAHVHTIEAHGPDRIAGFSPIPAMSMASYAGGTRFLSLIGGVCLSFYDWYADLPPASPQIWGDQTDVPESADWFDAGYLMMWGSNIPMTRTPDAHFMTEARYRGQKTVVVSPDYSDHTKFADDWLPAQPGADGALAMAMTHVILREFHVERRVPYFEDYVRRFTDLPFLVRLDERDGTLVPGRYLRASDVGFSDEHAEWKPTVFDTATAWTVAPQGTIGDRWGAAGEGRWNLKLDGIDPALTLLGDHEELLEVTLPRFDGEDGEALRRGVPIRRVGGVAVTTVFDLLCAQLGVRRSDALPGAWPSGYDDPSQPYTPAWQEPITGVEASVVTRIAREFARNAERTNGRSMIVMGAGTNHWFHSDLVYRAMLNLVLLCGCQGVNGGGWAHYVGQEKVRTITGFSALAFGGDWARPPRHQAATPYWYLATGQWRYEDRSSRGPDGMPPNACHPGMHPADANALAARLGWLPSYPTFDRNPLDLVAAAEAEGVPAQDYVVRELKADRLRFACEDPDAPESFPRVLTVWRSNLLGASSKGHEYFLKHLLGVETNAVANEESAPEDRPHEVRWRERCPEGRLDLLVTLDFRMNGTCLHSDVVLPAATWYEKHDIATTDLHPFVHSFNPAIAPPWEARSDWDAFRAIAEAFSRIAARRLGVRRDLVAAPLLHDTPDELAQPLGEVRDWRAGACEPIPGRTMPKLVVVERDYGAVAEQMSALGPLVEQAGTAWKGLSWAPAEEVEQLRAANGVVQDGVAAGRPRLARPEHVCEAILALSGTTNGRIAAEGMRALERRSGVPLLDLVEEHGDERISFRDVGIQPRKTLTSAEWSGIESRERRYSPFTLNVEREIPWRTLTGRQQLYQDHAWLLAAGEALPAYKPPLPAAGREPGELAVAVRYLTPHSKWSVHSTYQDNLHMLTLFRGGPVVWMSREDAERIGVRDNDWIEMTNPHGAVAARAVVSHRIPQGTALMYHAQDRHVNVPKSETTGTRGGTHNSVTRIQMKPTHMVGGYAHLAYGFNYYGPTGSQRDEVTLIRRRRTEVTY